MPTSAPTDAALSSAPSSADRTSTDPLTILREVFGYTAFRGHQAAIVRSVIEGQDALVLMPTGGGKSLCYQVPAIARHRAGLGVTIVVSPLIALMHDQVGALDEAGVPSAFLNSSLDSAGTQQVERDLLSGRLVLLYAAPERITHPRFLAMLESLHERQKLSLFAIDEAHCVSQWGHDFREDYLQLGVLTERFAGVPRMALTATADSHTQADILERLSLQAAQQFVSSFDRPNIRYTIVEKDNARTQLLRFLRDEHEGDAGIVYCQSRKKVEETAEWLQAEGLSALPYHAGLDANTRRRHQDRFLREDGLIMVATVAFGMGIDKPDVRFVAHLDLPKNIEGYYQETGRAGRDGEPANAWMSYGLADVVNQRRMIDESTAGDEFKRLQRSKLDALLAMSESLDCRRVRLLQYFGEDPTRRAPDSASGFPGRGEPPRGVVNAVSLGAPFQGWKCNNCDNCLQPPARWDATEAARMALSCIYRCHQHSGFGFGSGHLIDVLRGQSTEKTRQRGHEQLSTWGIGRAISETQWRGVIRQLIALGHVVSEGEYFTLGLADSARAVLRGEITIELREPREATPRSRGSRTSKAGVTPKVPRAAATLDAAGQARFAALKAWRSEVAKEHNLPAYIVFNDATLAQMAADAPDSLDALAGISGVGAKKLEAYGRELLRVLDAVASPQ
ncbi:MAG: RecQ family ATP-dependent DNA helicase [Ideonella sp.]|nr:RecQ family ATP-dependent DNA helicase [Ideonella sp.]